MLYEVITHHDRYTFTFPKGNGFVVEIYGWTDKVQVHKDIVLIEAVDKGGGGSGDSYNPPIRK